MASLPSFTNAFLCLTNACNLKCSYCFVHQSQTNMEYETAVKAVDFLCKNSDESGAIPGIVFFGGEPMLRWDAIVVPLTTLIRSKYGDRFRLSITTNGTLLDENRLKYMKDNGISILLSMDGDRQTQNINRSDSFDVVESKLPMILDYFPSTCFRATVTQNTCMNLFHDMMFAERKGFRDFFVVPNTLSEWNGEQIDSLREEVRKYGDYYIQSCRDNITPLHFSTFENMFKEIVMINGAISRNEHRTMDRCLACGKCGVGSSYTVAISPSGGLFTCQEMCSSEDKFNPFYIGSLDFGVDENRRIALIDRINQADYKGGDCKSCRFDRICNGGCVANNYLCGGDVDTVPPIYCSWNQILLEEATRVMTTLGDENNRFFVDIWKRCVS